MENGVDLIKTASPGVFGDVTFLEIEIKRGQLVEIQEGALSGSFNTATSLDFGDNKISSFPGIELDKFTQLKRLNLALNNFQEFPSLKSSTLSVIRFDYNPLTNLVLPATAVRDLPNLSRCDFDHTGILHIESGELKDFS